MRRQMLLKQLGVALFSLVSVVAMARDDARPMGAMKSSGKPRPALSVGAAFAPDGKLWVAGLDERARLFIQSSQDVDGSWNPRQILETQGDTISADGENRPKIAFGADGVVIVAYTKPLAKPFTGDIRMLRSADGGKTFSAPITVHDDRQPITHRFESIAFDKTGDLYVTWIDKRDAEAARVKAGGTRSAYQGAAIYGKVSNDGGKSFGPDLKLADSSCECCRIAMVDSPKNGMVAMWRHVFDGSIRDHGFTPLVNLGKTQMPTRATEDGWVLNGCPHHGPGLANAANGGFHAVWFGLKAGKSAVRYGRLDDTGKPAGHVRELPDDKAEHADIVSTGKSVVIVWRSFDGAAGLTRLRAWISADEGETFVQKDIAASAEDNDHPRLLANNSNAYVVWRTEKNINVYKIMQ